MSTKKRVATVRILVSGHASLTHSPRLQAILGELNRLESSAKVPKHNGWLLGMLHTTRALDTTLREVLAHKGWLEPKHTGLGSYLIEFKQMSVLTEGERSKWQGSIVDKRNKFMHTAGAIPTQLENDAIQSEMEACLTIILGRV